MKASWIFTIRVSTSALCKLISRLILTNTDDHRVIPLHHDIITTLPHNVDHDHDELRWPGWVVGAGEVTGHCLVRHPELMIYNQCCFPDSGHDAPTLTWGRTWAEQCQHRSVHCPPAPPSHPHLTNMYWSQFWKFFIQKNLHSISCFKNLLRIFVEFADFPSLKISQIDLIHSSSVTQHQPGRASNKIRSVSVTTKLVHSDCSIFTQPIPGEFLRQISEIWSALSSHIHMALRTVRTLEYDTPLDTQRSCSDNYQLFKSHFMLFQWTTDNNLTHASPSCWKLVLIETHLTLSDIVSTSSKSCYVIVSACIMCVCMRDEKSDLLTYLSYPQLN